MMTSCRFAVAAVLVSMVVGVAAPAVYGQVLPTYGSSPGVYVEPDGTVKRREVDEKNELATMRARMKAAGEAAKNEKLAVVSLPQAFAAAREAIAAGKPVPEQVRFLGGLTQVKYVFVYGAEKDLVIAGPAEPIHVLQGDDGYAVGTRTGRPLMRLEDLVVAMRVVRDARNQAFGCRLDPDPAAPQRIADVMGKMARASRPARIKAVQQATGPQQVSFFGSVPADTRFAFTTVAADYELKRYGLGLALHTVPGLGTIVDNTRAAVNMIWFELAYDPILVSAEGDAFGLSGKRLRVQAGSFDWDPKGATPKAFEFAKKMSDNLESLATQQPLVADLQNLADLSVLAALIQKDRLDEKAGWDRTWLLQASGDSMSSFPIAKVVTPKTADALAAYSNGSIAAGGVVLSPSRVLGTAYQVDEKKQLQSPRAKRDELRKQKQGSPAVVQE